MPGPGNDRTVEERLEKARLMPRISPEVLSMCKSVDQLLHAQHTSNLAQAVVCVQEIARDNFAVVVALKWVVLLVDMLESDTMDVRLASCNALAAVSVAQEGRDAVRSSGGLRPLVMLLAEGSRSPIAAAAAAALMNCSACDVCKEAIADCRGVPQLLALIRDAVTRCSSGSSSSSSGAATASGSSRGAGDAAAAQDLRTPGECKAAAYAAGALMNMGGVVSVQEKMQAAGAVAVFEAAIRVATPGDVVATRANFMLTWLAVGTGNNVAPAERRSGHGHQPHPQQHQGVVSNPRSHGPSGTSSARASGSGVLPTPPGSAQPQQRLGSSASSKAAGKAAVVAGHA